MRIKNRFFCESCPLLLKLTKSKVKILITNGFSLLFAKVNENFGSSEKD